MWEIVVRALWAILSGYFVWRGIKFLQKYRSWGEKSRAFVQLGPMHLLWGHLHLLPDVSTYFRVTRALVKKQPTKAYSGWLAFFYPVFAVCHPDTAKVLLKSSAPKSKNFAGDGLLVSDGKKWERNRRLLTPAFHFDILLPYFKTYNSVADVYLNKLDAASVGGESVEIYHPTGLATLDTMLQCALSYSGRVQEEGDNHPYVSAVKRLTHICLTRSIHPILFFSVIFNLTSDGREHAKLVDYVHSFTDNIIASRRKALDKDPTQLQKRRLDFLDILITAKDDSGEGLTDLDIRTEVDTFLFEGHDTTASAISWAIYCLAKYPEEQQLVYEELQSVVQDHNYVDWEKVQKLHRLTLFIKEVLRMYSPVPMIGRQLNEPLVLEGVEIPVGFSVDLNIDALHHNPICFPDHEVFRPDRFQDELSGDRHPFIYLPFSASSRNCIGQNFAMNEIKVILSRMVLRFRIGLDHNHEVIMEPVAVRRAKNGIKVTLEKR